jgi:hypothetical protein
LINIGLILGLLVLLVALSGLGFWAFTLLSDAIRSPVWPTMYMEIALDELGFYLSEEEHAPPPPLSDG